MHECLRVALYIFVNRAVYHTKSGYEIALIEKQGASEQREQGEIGFQALNGIKK